MRLTDLNPRWLSCLGAPEDARLGVSFDCPCCKSIRLGIFFANPTGGDPVALERFKEAQCDCEHPDYQGWMNATHMGSTLWQREGDSFEDLSLSPSVDASKFGHWHGHVKAGCITP